MERESGRHTVPFLCSRIPGGMSWMVITLVSRS